MYPYDCCLVRFTSKITHGNGKYWNQYYWHNYREKIFRLIFIKEYQIKVDQLIIEIFIYVHIRWIVNMQTICL